MKVLDSHHHIWKLNNRDWYGWLKPEMTKLYKDYDIKDYRESIEVTDIEGSILVQAADTHNETLFMIKESIGSNGLVKGVVGWFDMVTEIEIVQQLVQSPTSNLVAIRPMLQDLPDDNWILNENLQPMIQLMIREQLVFDALVFPRHLPYLITFYQRHNPHLKMVIDHCAKPDINGLSLDNQWCQSMKWFATNTNVNVKLSGLLTQIQNIENKTDKEIKDVLYPYFEFLLSNFTSRRLIWGSDWPVINISNHSLSYWLQCSQSILKQLNCTQDDLNDIYYNNAKQYYNLK
ncbi:hypothetical protein DLAC_03085 [Tieghemostelium lacteum]|uniref:Amidohydrolase-related domain-containing protein n=1 Tax=Tieghemostelium lacteum TaxID=361077 RepID=A0A152A2Q0_TIELA|nr:hypothetical protein DLAC_03085 [Tieghemostelium lacteum]|eukprot:KYR00341.1 hypothetical protein DLAC_03085 [Tieghemostelium lacteum]